jgi:hypothetical protein
MLYPGLSPVKLVGTDLVQAIPLVLAAALASRLLPGSGLRWTVAILVALPCALWVGLDPVTGLVAFACLHNLSPLGFLIERLGRRGGLLAAPVFLLLPALLASGVPESLFTLPPPPPEFGGLARASLLSAFVPAELVGPRAWSWFRACVFLQCAHYVFVLWVLPRLGPGRRPTPLFGWPAPRRFARGVAAVGLASAAVFAVDFGAARAHYAIPAALHAWIEVPLLVLALRWPSTTGSQPSCSLS